MSRLPILWLAILMILALAACATAPAKPLPVASHPTCGTGWNDCDQQTGEWTDA